MSSPFVGEIRMFGGSFAPAGWAFCDGALIPISENDTLFNLIGTTYGGDGQETFALPNLCGRVPLHQGADPAGNNYILGEAAGVESVTLTTQQIPIHTHSFTTANTPGTTTAPAGNLTSNSPNVHVYTQDVPDVTFNNQTIGPTGGSQPHENMQPYLAISFIISLFGIFPHT